MIVRMFSFRPLVEGIRGSFELPAWPYTTDDASYKQFSDYLTNMGIFWYEDSDADAPFSKVFTFPVNFELPPSFIALRHRLVVDDATFKVKNWPAGFRRDPKNIGWKNQADHYGDEYAWEEFNIPGEVTYYVDGGAINFRVLDEYLMNPVSPTCIKNQGKK